MGEVQKKVGLLFETNVVPEITRIRILREQKTEAGESRLTDTQGCPGKKSGENVAFVVDLLERAIFWCPTTGFC